MSHKRSQTRRSVQPQCLPRRRFLRGVLAGGASVSIGLPLLESMVDANATALADGSALPMRFGTYHWGGGIYHSAWVPSQSGTGWTPSESLQPFTELNPVLKQYMTVVTKTNHRGCSPGHIPARGIALSSSHDNVWHSANVGAGYRGQNMPEPSVDVIVRDAWRGLASQRDSIHLAVTKASPYHGNSSWNRGGRAFNTPESSPQALYDALFSGTTTPMLPPAGGQQSLLRLSKALEASMLDAVLDDTRRLKANLSSTDQHRMDEHLEGLRLLEQRVQSFDPDRDPVVCDQAAPGVAGSLVLDKSRVMSELLAVALACDLTRVFSYEWSANQSEFVYSDLGISGTHHEDVTHRLGSRSGDMRKVVGLIMNGYAHLAEALRTKTELDGNVLDRTLILGTSEHANAGGHNYKDHPFLLLGKAGGGIRAGTHWAHPNPSGNNDAPNVLLTAVRAVGVPLERLGMAATTDSRGTGIGSRQTSTSISAIEG